MSAKAEVRELIGRVERAGYEVRASGREHFKVFKDGHSVVDENGPITLPSTPSSRRWRENAVGRLMAAGVLTIDPYKAQRGRLAVTAKPHPLTTPEAKAAKLAAIHAKSERLRERTAALRARVEPIIAKGGGWGTGSRYSSGIAMKEFGEVAYHWALLRGRVELPKKTISRGKGSAFVDINPSHVVAATGHLKIPGHTLGERWLPFFEVFVDDLERNAGTPPKPEKALERYFELLREAQGISNGPQSPAAGEPKEVELIVVPAEVRDEILEVEEIDRAAAALVAALEDERAETVEAERPFRRSSPDRVAVPTIALKALLYMSRGADTEVEVGIVLALAEEIADLELNGA